MTLPNLKPNHHPYLKACSTLILSSKSDSLKYKQAGEYLAALEENFIPEKGMPTLSPDELTKIALVNQNAMSYILSNRYFSEKLSIKHLTQLANHSLKAAFHILYGKHFLKKFGRDRMVNNLKQGRYHFINALAQNRIESYNDQ